MIYEGSRRKEAQDVQFSEVFLFLVETYNCSYVDTLCDLPVSKHLLDVFINSMLKIKISSM